MVGYVASGAGGYGDFACLGDSLLQFKQQIREGVPQPSAGSMSRKDSSATAFGFVIRPRLRGITRGIGWNGHLGRRPSGAPGKREGRHPRQRQALVDHVRLVGVVGLDRQLGPTNSETVGMNQIQQTLESKNPAKPFGAVADSGLKPAAQLSFAQVDGRGQAGYRRSGRCCSIPIARMTAESTNGSASAR